jgi:hypothetical protein
MGEPPEIARRPIHVDFLPEDSVNLDGRLGITHAPGAHGDLDADLLRLRDRYHAHLLVSLLDRGQFLNDEFSALGVPDLLVRAQRAGIETEWSAMPDGNVPVSLEQLLALVERVLTTVRAGRTVVLHDRDGLGRAALVASCCLTALGASVDEAVRTVRSARPGALELTAHTLRLRAFDGMWRRRALMRAQPMSISDMFSGASAEDSSGSHKGARVSQTGLAPLSHAGAATLSFLGVDADALAAGVPPPAPLRDGDLFHIRPGTAIWFGRGTECDVSIASNQLSRLHAMVAFTPVAESRLLLIDLNSRNGTWVDDAEIAVHYLATGDEFSLAKAYRFRFESIS